MTPTGIVLYHGIDSDPELAGYCGMAEDAGFDSHTILWYGPQLFEFSIILIRDRRVLI